MQNVSSQQDTPIDVSPVQTWDKQAFLDGAIYVVTQLNDSRLYYLWMKYWMLAGVDTARPPFENAIPALMHLQSVSDASSYAFYALRLTLRFLALQNAPSTPIPPFERANDALWGISNLLSATCLCSSKIRPELFTPGWWGNASMQALLIYDVWAEIAQHNIQERSLNQAITPEDNEGLIELKKRHHAIERYARFSKISYNAILVVGFGMFRGFVVPQQSPLMGTTLCVAATSLLSGVQWTLYALKQAETLSAPVATGLSLVGLLDCLFPLMLLGALKNEEVLMTLLLGLSLRTALHGYLKLEKKASTNTPLLNHSLFSSTRVHVSQDHEMKCDDEPPLAQLV